MGKRRKHQETGYETARKAYRKECPVHVVSFETDMTEDQKRHAFAIAEYLRKAGNELAGELWKRYRQMARTKAYRALQRDYKWHKEHMEGLDKGSEKYKELDAERKILGDRMSKMQEQYGVTWDEAQTIMADIAARMGINSIFALSRAEDVWEGMEKVLFKGANRIHFRKRGDLPIIRAKQTNRGIPIHINEKDGNLSFSMGGVGKFGLLPIRGDLFLEEEYAGILDYLLNPGKEEAAVRHYQDTGEAIPVFRPCYAVLKCITIRGRLRVYVQVTVSGHPMQKKNKDGSPRHKKGTGRAGIDLGTQSCAAVTGSDAELFNLAERNGHCTKEYESRKKYLLRAMDRSRRAMNPDRFNKDGTYKKGSRGPWKKSNRYLRLEQELHELERRNADSRKYAVREDVNRLRSKADICIIEPPNAKKLQKRAKKTEREEKVSLVKGKDGSMKEVHKFKKKKRFGKSILHRCPGAFQAELEKKFGDGYHVVPASYRASQYDHELDGYIKKKLSQRWHSLPDGKRVQRDLYSAFLLYCADSSFTAIDRTACIQEFSRFWDSHQELVEDIIRNGLDICNSGIRTA